MRNQKGPAVWMKNVRNSAIYNFRLFNIHRTCNVGVTLFKSPAIMVTQAKISIQFMDLVLLSLQVVAYARRVFALYRCGKLMSIRCPPFITITKKRKEKTEKVVLWPACRLLSLLVTFMNCFFSVLFSNPGGRSPMHQGSQDGTMVSIFCCCWMFCLFILY